VGKRSLNAAQPYAKAEGRVFLLVPAYPGCPGTKAVKRLLLLLLIYFLDLSRTAGVSDMTLYCRENDLEIVLPTDPEDIDVDSSSIGNVCFYLFFIVCCIFIFPFLSSSQSMEISNDIVQVNYRKET